MQLDITHTTQYHYAPAVQTSRHVAHLRPMDSNGQRTLSHYLDIQPQPSELNMRLDAFGNHLAEWAMYSPHTVLQVNAHSRVQTYGPIDFACTSTWEDAAAHFHYQAGQAGDPAVIYTFPSSYVPMHPDLLQYALHSFSPGSNLVSSAISLMNRIHNDFVYDSNSTDVSTPTLTAFAQRRGVCQDFAHIMIGCLRSLGLAARYVSGYMLTHPLPGQPRLIGCDASHAWVSLYVPQAIGTDAGPWYELDPTNNRSAHAALGEDYVQLAAGRDYADVSPLRGVIQGGNHHTMNVGVTVSPT
jgi:transglutaminase-like putative cysteine protease